MAKPKLDFSKLAVATDATPYMQLMSNPEALQAIEDFMTAREKAPSSMRAPLQVAAQAIEENWKIRCDARDVSNAWTSLKRKQRGG